MASRLSPTGPAHAIDPESIFVLRNNDLGDVLVITPLFQALHDLYPKAKIVAGVGDWSRPLLEHNPYISEVLPINAPWHNQAIKDQSLMSALSYILCSDESQRLSDRHFDIGVDVVGSHFGSLLMVKAGIPYRIGVKGFAGGYSATHSFVNYNHYEHVGRSALRFAEILGAVNLPEVRPQIFLSAEEKAEANRRWQQSGNKRIVVGPGGGFVTKCWPTESYKQLLSALDRQDAEIIIVGADKDIALADELAKGLNNSKSLAGKLTLRQTLALVASSNLVICNSSMLMHAAAAFNVPHTVPLGDYFVDAKQHMSQWGYPSLTHCLGKDEDRKTIYEPAEVLSVVKQLL